MLMWICKMQGLLLLINCLMNFGGGGLRMNILKDKVSLHFSKLLSYKLNDSLYNFVPPFIILFMIND